MRRLACAVVIVALLGACSGDGDSDDADRDGATTTSTSTPNVTEKLGGVNAIIRGTSIAVDGLAVEMDDNYFSPTVITGTAGQTVNLQLNNEGTASHNFSLTEQKIDTVIGPDSSDVVRVTLPKSGDLVFFCKFHKDESGMVGALRIQ